MIDSAVLKWLCFCVFFRNFVQLKAKIAGAVRIAVKSITHVVGLKVHVPLDFIV